jgi:hypothetical protein
VARPQDNIPVLQNIPLNGSATNYLLTASGKMMIAHMWHFFPHMHSLDAQPLRVHTLFASNNEAQKTIAAMEMPFEFASSTFPDPPVEGAT